MSNQLYGYDPLGLVPKIIIKNVKTGATVYTYEAKQLGTTRDFKLESWNLTGGVGNNHGSFECIIDDTANLLTDDTIRAKSTIKNQWKVLVYLGKRSTSINLWFTSFIHGVRLVRLGTNSQKFRLFAIGQGVRNHDRLINAEFYQKKDANGLDLDETDNDAKISEIITKLIENSEFYAYPTLGTEGFTTVGIEDIDVKMPNFIKRYEPLGVALSELANIAGCHFGVSAAGDVYLRYRGSASSGFLITNDLDGLEWQNWDNNKKMVLKNAPNWWEDGTIEAGIPFLYGVGPDHVTLDYAQTSANATFDLSTYFIAIPFDPTKDNILKISPYLSKNATPTKPLTICIIGDDGAGAPNPDDIRLKKIIRTEELVAQLGSAKYFEVSFEKIPVEPNVTLYIYIEKYQDATNYIGWDYQTGAGTYFRSATGAVGSFTSQTGNFKVRTFHGDSMVIILENTVSRKSFPDREDTVDMKEFTEEEMAVTALIGLSDSIGKERRIYSGIKVAPPTTPFDLGKTVKIHDKFNNLTIDTDIIGYSIGGGAKEVNEMEITIEEYTY